MFKIPNLSFYGSFQSSRDPVCHDPRRQAILGLVAEYAGCDLSNQVYNKK